MSTQEKNHARFLDKLKKSAKENIKNIINGEFESIKGGKAIKVPVDSIHIPVFRYGENGKGGVGRGDGEIGDIIGIDEGQGNGKSAGKGAGKHSTYVEFSLEELAEILHEELHLPNILPKGQHTIKGEEIVYNSLATKGPDSLRHKKRTLKNSIIRSIIEGSYDFSKPKIIVDKDDFVYKSWQTKPVVTNNAVVFYMMDVSGCHTEGHFIEMADGSYKDVKDVKINDEVSCVDVNNYKKTNSKVLNTFKYNVSNTFSIKTEDNVELNVTPNHVYFVYDEINNKIIEKKACELKINDNLILINKHGSEVENFEENLSESEAYLLGAILGDGNIYNKKNCKYINITDVNIDRLENYKKLFEKEYGVTGIIKTGARNRLHVNSSNIVKRYSEKFPMVFTKSKEAFIDPLIFKQKTSIRTSFLQGIFDAEGTVSKHSVMLFSTSLNLVKQIKLLLSYWGIRARVIKKIQPKRKLKDRTIEETLIYVLSINSKDTIIFYNNIGFKCKIKTEKLINLVKKQINMIDAMRTKYISNPNYNIKDFYFENSLEKIKSSVYNVDKNAFSKSNLIRIKNNLIYKDEKIIIDNIIENRFVKSKILSIENNDKCVEVYDFEVENYNNYIIDGVLSHNSMEREQLEIIKIICFWIECWLRKFYQLVEIKYIVHDWVAGEVTKEQFYSFASGGGTKISSAFQILAEQIKKNYPINDWNIYPFYFGDMDNVREDNPVAIDILLKEIIPMSNQFSMGLLKSGWKSTFSLIEALDKVATEEQKIRIVLSILSSKDDCYSVLKSFLGRGN